MTSLRVVVADDHDLFRRGLTEVLEEEPDIEVVGEARNGQEAVQRAEQLMPDVLYMGLNMPGQGGIEATAYLSQSMPDLKVLVLTVSEDPGDLFQALGVGALGYVLKTATPSDIVDALKQVHQGWVVISPSMAPRFLSDLSRPPDPAPSPAAAETHLTLREQEILMQVARGLSNMEIADALLVSENTVKTHIKNILDKLHSKSRSQAVAYAAKLGFLGAEPRPSR